MSDSLPLASPARSWRLAQAMLAVIVLLAASGFVIRRIEDEVFMRQREQKLLPLIEDAARRHHLEPSLVRALIWRESRFKAHATGRKGEVGLMQLLPAAVEDWARVNHMAVPHPRTLRDPATNLEIGCWYLSKAGRQWEEYTSSAVLQLAQYNAGRSVVLQKWAPANKEMAISPDDISYKTTREYIKAILKRKKAIDDSRKNE